MPGQERDAVKAEKQEEEEESEGPNEDDKLYCVCKTKYDEDRFMIACDRYEFFFLFIVKRIAHSSIKV